MPDSIQSSSRWLDPIDRITEVLFGLIMVLTFTGSLSVAEADRAEVRDMLIGAIGCNIAWGIIDAIFYLMTTLTERGRGLISMRAVRSASKAEDAHRVIADALPPVVVSVMRPEEIESLRQRLQALPDPPHGGQRGGLGKDDWLAALGVFLWVFVSTFPVVLPFLFMHDAKPALRVSNAIAIVMLFFVGFALGRQAGHRPWMMGLAMVFVGAVLVAMTIALGG
jgi:VIT1/CCC1 family predicted Fe2+/Mn2+ transporter